MMPSLPVLVCALLGAMFGLRQASPAFLSPPLTRRAPASKHLGVPGADHCSCTAGAPIAPFWHARFSILYPHGVAYLCSCNQKQFKMVRVSDPISIRSSWPATDFNLYPVSTLVLTPRPVHAHRFTCPAQPAIRCSTAPFPASINPVKRLPFTLAVRDHTVPRLFRSSPTHPPRVSRL